MIMLGGYGTVTGPLLGAFLYEELRGYLLTSPTVSQLQLVIAGALLLAMVSVRAGRPGGLYSSALAAQPDHPAMTAGEPLLEVDALSKRFGGVQAVADLSFTVAARRDSRPHRPQRGRQIDCVQSDQRRLSAGFRPHRFRRRRYHRQADLRDRASVVSRARTRSCSRCAELSVLDNCLVGACYGRGNLSLAAGRKVVGEVAELVGLADRLAMPAGQLTTAGKKRLELARALCARPRLLLLDEVLAGLNLTEIAGMVETISTIRARGVSILMIEHVMTAIMSLSDRVVALNLGRKLAEGSPHAVANDPAVVEAYLGDPKLMPTSERHRHDRESAAGGIARRPGTAMCRSCGGFRSQRTAARSPRWSAPTAPARPQRCAPSWAASAVRGRVLFAGEDVTALSPHAKTARGLVLVPEGRQLFAEMSVEENLEMGAFSSRARQRFADRLDQVYTLFPRL